VTFSRATLLDEIRGRQLSDLQPSRVYAHYELLCTGADLTTIRRLSEGQVLYRISSYSVPRSPSIPLPLENMYTPYGSLVAFHLLSAVCARLAASDAITTCREISEKISNASELIYAGMSDLKFRTPYGKNTGYQPDAPSTGDDHFDDDTHHWFQSSSQTPACVLEVGSDDDTAIAVSWSSALPLTYRTTTDTLCRSRSSPQARHHSLCSRAAMSPIRASRAPRAFIFRSGRCSRSSCRQIRLLWS